MSHFKKHPTLARSISNYARMGIIIEILTVNTTEAKGWLDSQLEFTTNEVVDLYFALKNRGFEPDMEKFDGHKHVDIVFERPKLHIEVDGIQHNQSTKQALSDLKRTFYSMQHGFMTLRIPNVLIRNELNKTVDYLVELILERYYKHIK